MIISSCFFMSYIKLYCLVSNFVGCPNEFVEFQMCNLCSQVRTTIVLHITLWVYSHQYNRFLEILEEALTS